MSINVPILVFAIAALVLGVLVLSMTTAWRLSGHPAPFSEGAAVLLVIAGGARIASVTFWPGMPLWVSFALPAVVVVYSVILTVVFRRRLRAAEAKRKTAGQPRT